MANRSSYPKSNDFVTHTVTMASVCWLNVKFEKQRIEQLEAVADELGLAFSKEGFSNEGPDSTGINFFDRGSSPKFRNTIWGDTDDVGLGIFDYVYTSGSSRNKIACLQTLIYFKSDELHLPQFKLSPKGLIQNVGNALGSPDINFSTHPEFSRKYQLDSENETAVRQLFQSELLDFFEKQRSSVSVEASGNRFILYRRQSLVSPKKLRGFMAEGFQIFQMLKSAQENSENVRRENKFKEECTVLFD